MKAIVFDTHSFERPFFEAFSAQYGHDLTFLETRLNLQTAKLAASFPALCAFAHDCLDAEVLTILAAHGTKLIALRSAGFNHVDLKRAKSLGLKVVRVPEYSPYSVAEFAMGLLLCLNRKIHKAYQRVKEQNFSLDGLIGFDLHGKTVGVIGTGRIGSAFAKIAHGFGCRVLAYDVQPSEALVKSGVASYVSLEQIYSESDVISLHVPLTPQTRHLINEKALEQMKPKVFLINTGRGALIDTKALIHALKSEKLGAAGLDVYEEEENVFFHDLSEQVIQDDVLARLMTFPNVLITSHQAFLTKEAVGNIVETTLKNLTAFEKGSPLLNEVSA